ncbi:hypothetical protein BDW62DRAFT_186025 [Aspergillus aurantiobrunneus]
MNNGERLHGMDSAASSTGWRSVDFHSRRKPSSTAVSKRYRDLHFPLVNQIVWMPPSSISGLKCSYPTLDSKAGRYSCSG